MAVVSKAVILAGGLGTRMLPATKAIPKEMLPIVDRPLIQYAVEEAVAAGIDEVIIVIAPEKDAIRAHFSSGGRVEELARARHDDDLGALVAAPAHLAHFRFEYQEGAGGIAHALLSARRHVEGQPFALLFPDDLILGHRPVTGQLSRVYESVGGSVIAVQPVAPAEVAQYGIVDPVEDANPARLRAVVEKPRPGEAPSDLGIVGRYILSPRIFDYIDRTEPGRNGELQITDALALQIAAGDPVRAFRYEGRRFDTGRPSGYLVANLAAGLGRPDICEGLRAEVAGLLAEYAA